MHIRAEQPCEAYRIRKHDLLAAVRTDPANEWFARFRLIESDMRRRLSSKFESAHGAVMCKAPHPSDVSLRTYKLERSTSARKAREQPREQRESIVFGLYSKAESRSSPLLASAKLLVGRDAGRERVRNGAKLIKRVF